MFRKAIDVLKERPWYQSVITMAMFDRHVAGGLQQGVAEARGEAVSMNTTGIYSKKKRMRLKTVRHGFGLFGKLLRRLGIAGRRFHNFEPNLILYGLKRDGGRE